VGPFETYGPIDPKEHLLISEMIEICKETSVEKILFFEEELWNTSNLSETEIEAIAKKKMP
jgi:hypothetical protein